VKKSRTAKRSVTKRRTAKRIVKKNKTARSSRDVPRSKIAIRNNKYT
jgi:hypothetical protein